MGRYGTRSITKAGNRAGVVSRLSPISSIIRDGHNANLVTKNRMILVRLKQLGILAPGVLTIDAMSELRADVSREEPDSGTMAGLFPNQLTAEIDEQIPPGCAITLSTNSTSTAADHLRCARRCTTT